jgi:creatinine amidohydrolase/Fe(II)-dependent formamide hydrolase-like protein
MASAVERIVVQATAQDKQAIAAKAKKLDMPISELMRRGAFAYESSQADEELGVLADAAKGAAERAGAAIDDALDFIEASNRRIAALEAKTAKRAPARKVA